MRPVNYLGPEGTFSHILARKRFGKRAVLTPCPTIEAIFDRVLASSDALGIVPIENSSGGTVYDSVDLLIRHAGRLFIREELTMDVRIALLGRAGNVISTVYSHFVQIKHHADWLKARHPRARVRAVARTGSRRSEGIRQQNSGSPRVARRCRGLRIGGARNSFSGPIAQRDPLFHHRQGIARV